MWIFTDSSWHHPTTTSTFWWLPLQVHRRLFVRHKVSAWFAADLHIWGAFPYFPRRPCSDSRHVTAPYKSALYYYYYYLPPWEAVGSRQLGPSGPREWRV